MTWNKRYSKTSHSRNNQSKKFGNKITEFEGTKFDSKLEVSIYKDLQELVENGELLSVTPHPESLKLFPCAKHKLSDDTDYLFRELVYKPDFKITSIDGREFYIDVKSYATITAEFIIKFKLCYHLLGQYINIVTKESWNGVDTIKDILEGRHYSALSKNKFLSL